MQQSKKESLASKKYEKSGLSQNELIDAYKKEVRSILELAVPVWHSGLTKEQSQQIETIQKISLAAILGQKYTSYEKALKLCDLSMLSDRRLKICSNFIEKNMRSASPMLPLITKQYDTRISEKCALEFQCRTESFFKSSLPFLARLFNQKFTASRK